MSVPYQLFMGRDDTRLYTSICLIICFDEYHSQIENFMILFFFCLLRNLYAGQEVTVRTGRGSTDWFQIGKGVRHVCILSPCLLKLYAEYTMWNAGLDEAQPESRLPGEISITSDMQMTPPLWQKLKKNWRVSWWKWKRRVKKLA